MTAPTYSTTCPYPKCGRTLQPVALDPLTAPWLCRDCSHGFFAEELSEQSRAAFRPQHKDWGIDSSSWVLRAAVHNEISEAVVRGTSLRADQLHLADPGVLALMARDSRIHVDFTKQIQAELTGRKAA